MPSLKSSPQDLGYGAQWPSANSTNDVSSKAKPLSLHALFSFKEFWLVTALDVMLWVVKASVTDWLQLYLVEEMGRSAATGKEEEGGRGGEGRGGAGVVLQVGVKITAVLLC